MRLSGGPASAFVHTLPGYRRCTEHAGTAPPITVPFAGAVGTSRRKHDVAAGRGIEESLPAHRC
ncbi:hypothetical protein B1987_20500 [Mycobacterium kansasii]|nr:hypothetical protein B1987_20500 [Mycobacterium kansasii]